MKSITYSGDQLIAMWIHGHFIEGFHKEGIANMFGVNIARISEACELITGPKAKKEKGNGPDLFDETAAPSVAPLAVAIAQETFLGVQDLADMLRLSVSSIRRMTETGKIPKPDIAPGGTGKAVRWHPTTIERWLSGMPALKAKRRSAHAKAASDAMTAEARRERGRKGGLAAAAYRRQREAEGNSGG